MNSGSKRPGISKTHVTVFSMRFGGMPSRIADRFRGKRAFRGRGILPTLRMKHGRAEIIGLAKTVKDLSRYGGVFTRGERILEVHVTHLGRDTTRLIGRFGESFEGLKKRGFAGFVGHTPSRPIGERFKEKYAMEEVPTTGDVEREVREHILRFVDAGEYPVTLFFSPIMSIVKRF